MAKVKLLASVLALAAPFLAQQAAAQCTGLAHETATTACPNACTDGISNDLDGLIDRADPDCQHESVTTWYAAACTDGIDQDGDGYIDRLAYGVNGSLGADPNCLIETNWGPYNACTDGINNDGDVFDNSAGGTTPVALIDRAAPVGATPDPECLGEVLCTDGVDNDSDGLADALDRDCQCLRPATGLDNCTANDFTIAFTANPREIADGCINSTDKVTLTSLRASLTAHSPDRYDLGLWIALDGTSAYDGGRCLRQMLTPVKKTFLSGDPGYPSGPYQSPGPYPTLETLTPQNNTDQCGEVGNTQTAVWQYPVPVTVPCNDLLTAPTAGFVDLGQCGSWDNNQTNSYCGSVSQAIPNNKAKCQCQTADTNVPAPNVRAGCDSFNTPTWLTGAGSSLDPGETVRFQLSFSNTVPGCSPAALPIADDPFGRTRCGTVSFMRFVVDYNLGGNDADAYGTFYLDNGVTEIPACPATAAVSQSPLAGAGIVCNDTAAKRLIWAPQDPITASGSYYPAYGVVSPFSGSIALPFRYRLSAAPPSGNVGLAATILWDATLDVDGFNGISTTEAVTVTPFSKLQTSCVGCTCATGFTTTPVTLASFAASREGSRVVFDWTTATEAGNVGFNLLGETTEGWVRLNRELVPAEGGDTLEPRSYSLAAWVPDDVTSFAIEDVDITGRSQQHAAGDLAPFDGSAREIEEVPLARIAHEHRAHAMERESELRGKAGAALRAAAATGLSVRTTAAAKAAPVIDLRVDRDGLFRVTYEDLLAAGYDLGAVHSAKLGLSNRGAAVPIRVSAGRTFGPGSYFDFHGRALDTLYTRTNVYRLEVDAVKPARAAVDAAAPAGTAASFYMETRDFEYNRDYSFSSPTGDPWFDARMLVRTTAAEWRFPFAVDGLHDGAATSRLTVRLFGGTDTQHDPDHHVVVALNGTVLGDVRFDGLADVPLMFDLPAGALWEGDNVLTVFLPADSGAPFDLVHLECWSVTYPRTFAAEAGALTFAAAGDRFPVAGLAGGEVVAYRTAGSTLTYLAGTTAGAGGATAEVRGGAAAATYLVSSAAALLRPEITPARPSVDITGGRAQYLVISHPDFIAGVGPLVAARQAQGLTVKVVDVEDIYSQFGHGIFDPTAIRAYIAQAAATMGTEYVVLIGGDTYDYRDYLGIGSVSFIPSLYSVTGNIVLYAPTDPAYADVNGDGVPDLAIGRLPVRTRAELDTLIGKILAYQNKDYAATAVFAADRADAAANVPFATASDALIGRLPRPWRASRVYLDQLAVADARVALQSAINGGVALTNYVGHSGPTTWTFKNLFNATDAAALTNAGRPTVVTQWGCWNSYYVNPRAESLATRLLLAGDRGAAAVLGATTLTEDVDENDLGALLAGRIAAPGTTLGAAILAAKRELAGDPAARADVLLGWVLLGDPALVVQP